MSNEDTTGGRGTTGTAPVGSGAGWWPSRWSAAQVAAGKVSRGGLQSDRGLVYWTESRPEEGGRQVVVEAGSLVGPGVGAGGGPGLTCRDVSPSGVSVRSRVHEYGGGAATVADGILYYVDQDDQDWYRVDLATTTPPRRLTSTAAEVRHTDGRTTPDGRWLVSVQERVTGGAATHRVIATRTDSPDGPDTSVVLTDVGHFVAAPRPSPDGRWLAWCTWEHPDMPWDAQSILVAPVVTDNRSDDGVRPIALGEPIAVAGGTGVSAGQPRWAADGSLVFVDDRTGWWLPYRIRPGAAGDAAEPLLSGEIEAEFHGPDWVFGAHTFDELADGSFVARMGTGGRDHLVVLRPPPAAAAGPDGGSWTITEVEQPCVSLAGVVSPDGVTAVVHGTTPTEAHAVFAVPLDGSGTHRQLSPPPKVPVGPEEVSRAVRRRAHMATHGVPGLFFAPANPDPAIDLEAKPPLVVFCHGGPTTASEPGYDPTVQFLTSRGIAVAAVDYRGSTGYGRAYRALLEGAWGEGDVDDCVAFATALAEDGLVDGSRMAIRGGSAGGLTALAALIRARAFAGAVAWYGVTDLLTLAADTHDFESRYLDRLVGPLPAAEDTYRDRSPLHHADGLVGKVLLLQGADDPIVPLDQAERFAERLRRGGADAELIVFEGESHGFRRADTIEAALTAELDFYRRLFAPATGPSPLGPTTGGDAR